MPKTLDIVVLGLSLRSSWGNGHATTYRALLGALQQRGHRVLFLERDVPWYAEHQDSTDGDAGDSSITLRLYRDLDELRDQHAEAVRHADLVIVGSYVPDGIAVGEWVQAEAGGVVAFYDIDTPVTLAALARGRCDYLEPRLVPGYDLYLSFTGGRVLDVLQRRYGAPLALPLYCCVDPRRYAPEQVPPRWDLGYMGTYSDDRQPALEALLLQPARRWPQGRFVVAGPQYPDSIAWPENVQRIEHLAPAQHRRFYNQQRFTLNITRADMVAAGWSPSVRLFEAAACATPIISDDWPGLDTFFVPEREILLAHSADEVLQRVRGLSEQQRRRIGDAARARVLAEHTAAHRAETLERYIDRAAHASAPRPIEAEST